MDPVLVGSLAPRGGSASCPRPKAFYSCVGNGFSGCCSVDPCDLPGCPDDGGSGSGGRLGDRDPGSGDEDGGSSSSRAGSRAGSRGGNGDERRPASEDGTVAASSSTRTDSGITHTIPNPAVVTVTRHTVVFSEAPSSTALSTTLPSEASTPLTSDRASTSTTVTPAPSATSEATSEARVDAGAGRSSKDVEAAGFSSGAIVGTVAGGIILGVILAILVVVWRRRKRNKAAASDADSAAAFQDGRGGSNDAEKPHQQPMSAHTTGSSDPFAPFGGRADVPPDPYRPASGTFEMDGTSMAPVELPAEPAAPSHALGPQAAQRAYRPYDPAGGPATDPRANLNALKTDSGHATYVNHWNQWKALGSGTEKS